MSNKTNSLDLSEPVSIHLTFIPLFRIARRITAPDRNDTVEGRLSFALDYLSRLSRRKCVINWTKIAGSKRTFRNASVLRLDRSPSSFVVSPRHHPTWPLKISGSSIYVKVKAKRRARYENFYRAITTPTLQPFRAGENLQSIPFLRRTRPSLTK